MFTSSRAPVVLNLAPWCLLIFAIVSPLSVSQELPEKPASKPQANPPLIMRDAARKPAPHAQELVDLVQRLHQEMREVAASDISAARKREHLIKVMEEHPDIFRAASIDIEGQLALDSAVTHLETMFFEVAADDSPTPQSKQLVLETAPRRLDLEHGQSLLIAPEEKPGELEMKSSEPIQSTPATVVADGDTTTAAATEDREAAKKDKVEVKILASETVTAEMHDDATVLRDVKDDSGGLVLGPLHLWMGGDMQFDSYYFDDVFNHSNEGDSETESDTRRAELVLRGSVFEAAEVKAQYDFESKVVRDLYWRWVSKSTASSVTVGNQKEPMGIDFLMSSKFLTAMERSAPSSAFKKARSQGVRYNHWFELAGDDRLLDIWQGDKTYMTTSIGIFGEDFEDTNNTDWAITGRLTGGSQDAANNRGMHIGFSASYRDGEFDSISARPEIQQADNIKLASMDADRQAILTGEMMYSLGSLSLQAELYFSDYRGGDIDATGWGGYGLASWMFDGHQRTYRPSQGLWGPISTGDAHIFEVFARTSYTHGNDDVNSSNSLGLLTLGGSWYHGRYRGSANLILAGTKRDLDGEDSGTAVSLRFQFLF
jgi:phosphate-selective porin OprO/OprP